MLCYFKPTSFHLLDPNGLLSTEIPSSLIWQESNTVNLVGREAKCQYREAGPGTAWSANRWTVSDAVANPYTLVSWCFKCWTHTGSSCCHFVSTYKIREHFAKGTLQDSSKEMTSHKYKYGIHSEDWGKHNMSWGGVTCLQSMEVGNCWGFPFPWQQDTPCLQVVRVIGRTKVLQFLQLWAQNVQIKQILKTTKNTNM